MDALDVTAIGGDITDLIVGPTCPIWVDATTNQIRTANLVEHPVCANSQDSCRT